MNKNHACLVLVPKMDNGWIKKLKKFSCDWCLDDSEEIPGTDAIAIPEGVKGKIILPMGRYGEMRYEIEFKEDGSASYEELFDRIYRFFNTPGLVKQEDITKLLRNPDPFGYYEKAQDILDQGGKVSLRSIAGNRVFFEGFSVKKNGDSYDIHVTTGS